jgi:hypothetical protein
MDWEHDPNDFDFYVDHLDDAYNMGDVLLLEDEAEANVILPDEADITLIRNSEAVQTERGFELVVPIDGPGVYRVEVRRNGAPWIFSNPIYVKAAQ